MSYFINNQQKVNDIIFTNRNKSYGAYTLRTNYGYTLMTSLIITAAFFAGIMGTAYYFTNHIDTSVPENNGQVIKDEILRTIVYQNKTMEELVKHTNKTDCQKLYPKTPKTLNNNFVIKDSVSEIKETPVLNNDLKTAESHSTGTEEAIKPGNDENKSGNALTNTEVKKIKKDIEVDSPPEFEGGLSALYRIISQNLHYPSEAIAEGRGGTVYINFIVDEQGKIDQVTLLNKKGFGLDEEALRVVKLLPGFKTPAKVKGEAVKMYFQLPIKFVLK